MKTKLEKTESDEPFEIKRSVLLNGQDTTLSMS